MKFIALALLSLAAIVSCDVGPATAQEIQLEYKPAPIDNPLKGLVPYWHQDGPFPCSMEFWYFPISDLMTGPDEYNWSSMEEKLEDVRSRGHQMVIRTFLEYPGKESAMPRFLLDEGVKLITYKNGDGINKTPDYHNPKLIQAMERFIAAFGKKYDGDPRIGYITMGVLGHWGEWHTYPRGELFATKAEQTKIQDAFAEAFKTTKILMRYPAGQDAWAHAANDTYPFGYHDDSFAWATLDTGKEDDSWFFEASMIAAGQNAMDKWKTQPIGGEIRPEVWGDVFDTPSKRVPKGQEFEKCVQRTHASWLMDSGMFGEDEKAPSAARIAEATRQVQRMGYELYVRQAKFTRTNTGGKNQISVELQVENRGVAPFYYEWPVVLVALDEAQRELRRQTTNWSLKKTLPGEPIVWQAEMRVPEGTVRLGLRVDNPMPGGKPLRFANQTQRDDGLLVLQP